MLCCSCTRDVFNFPRGVAAFQDRYVFVDSEITRQPSPAIGAPVGATGRSPWCGLFAVEGRDHASPPRAGEGPGEGSPSSRPYAKIDRKPGGNARRASFVRIDVMTRAASPPDAAIGGCVSIQVFSWSGTGCSFPGGRKKRRCGPFQVWPEKP